MAVDSNGLTDGKTTAADGCDNKKPVDRSSDGKLEDEAEKSEVRCQMFKCPSLFDRALPDSWLLPL